MRFVKVVESMILTVVVNKNKTCTKMYTFYYMYKMCKKCRKKQSFCFNEQKLDKNKNRAIINMVMKMNSKNIYREEYMKKLNSYKDKKIIKVLTGIRRSGKSTILNEFKKQLIKNGVSEKNIVSINFEDNNNKELLDAQKLHDFIINNTDEHSKNYVFLDEIQNVEGFQKCVDSLFLREYLDIYITIR